MDLESREVLLVVIGAGASFDCIPLWQLGAVVDPLLEPNHLVVPGLWRTGVGQGPAARRAG